MILIDDQLLNEVSEKAGKAPRRRMNYNFHKEYSDPMQRLLNAMEPLSYIRPHKHEDPDKREVFQCLRGRVLAVEFDKNGEITGYNILDPLNGRYGVEIAERVFHTVISLDPGTVVFEIKDGPYAPVDDKAFAPWAPPEGDPGVGAYLESLLRRTGL